MAYEGTGTDTPVSANGSSLGLALSGGGFRAMLFHLGVVRYLRDVGLLTQVTHLSSVSGGSVLAAHLVLYWQDYLGSKFEARAQQLIDFAQFDLRGRIVRRALSLPRLARPRRGTPTNLLIDYYSNELYDEKPLKELEPSGTTPPRPSLGIFATDLESGRPCAFSHEGLRLYGIDGEVSAKVGDRPIALAVAASSAFPALFGPVHLTPRSVGLSKADFLNVDHLFLTDGGVYDNLGQSWFGLDEKSPKTILVSDASRVASAAKFPRWSPIRYVKGLQRSFEISANRLYQTDIDLLKASQDGRRKVHFAIGRPLSEMRQAALEKHPLPSEVRLRIKDVRTDFDLFPGNTIRALVKHGQSVAHDVLDGQSLPDHSFDSSRWVPYDPRPTHGSGGELTFTPADYHSARRRPVRLMARDGATITNVIGATTGLGLAAFLWWSSGPAKPQVLNLNLTSATIFSATAGPERQWLLSSRDALLNAGTDDIKSARLSSHQIVLVSTQPFRRDTPPFTVTATPREGYKLRVEVYRMREEGSATLYTPLTVRPEFKDGRETGRWTVAVPASAAGDTLLMLEHIGAVVGTVPSDAVGAASLFTLEVV